MARAWKQRSAGWTAGLREPTKKKRPWGRDSMKSASGGAKSTGENSRNFPNGQRAGPSFETVKPVPAAAGETHDADNSQTGLLRNARRIAQGDAEGNPRRLSQAGAQISP